jgi:uncharacterized protein with ParB-like and HNH nuclease domain
MAELNVSRKNISKLFTDMQSKKFIIPDYQRPYKWDNEKCETLWMDIVNFHSTKTADEEYFLGTIVSYSDVKKNVEIIDGQQRITSFILLLRAFYKKLELMDATDNKVIGLKNQIAPCIWDIDPISQQVEDFTQIHIESLVATDEDKEVFHKILETGEYDENANDYYSSNFKYFYEQCNEYAQTEPMQWYSLCVTILQKCIILPIECDEQATALTIFSTLNDRGLPLSDSDIFKAQIYKSKDTPEDKKEFTEIWKELTSICLNAGISLDDIFRFYTHIIRAQNNDKTKEVGLRKFYAYSQYERLREENLLDNLIDLANFWLYVNTGKNTDLGYEFTFETQKYLHCLKKYPNEFWKYIVSVYFFVNNTKKSFNSDFSLFLEKLLSFLLVKFIEKPTVNAIKDDIYQRCIAIKNETDLNFILKIDKEELKKKLSLYNSSKITRILLLLHAYLNPKQNNIVPDSFDIEHIFPKKWQNTNYNGWNKEDADDFLEKFGNKVVIEKKINIQAGNGYFGNKQLRYKSSKVADIAYLVDYDKEDWLKEDILNREDLLSTKLVDFFMTNLE